MNTFRFLSALLLLSFIYTKAVAQSPNIATDMLSMPAYQEGRVYVKIKDNANLVLPEYKRGDKVLHYPLLGDMLSTFGVERIFRPFPLLKGVTFQNTYQIDFAATANADLLVRNLTAIGAVEYAEKVPAEYIMVDPNDPKENDGSLWYLSKVKAHQAWDLGLGSGSIVVAVVDDAVYTQHEDVNMWVNPNEIANNNIDDDSNGYIDDINGYDVADSDNNPNPPAALVAATSFAHGSHCASIVAARTNNGLGLSSIGYGIKVMGIKATSDGGSPTMITHGWQGIQYAIASGADVISLSWGGTSSSNTYQNIINNAEAQGIVFVAAAGNSNVNIPFYPAAYDNVIAVAATDQSDVKASYSNYGSWVDIAAPGNIIHGILATGPSNYGIKSGTSMATPVVASAIGLMLSNNPALTPTQIRTCLSNGADNIDSANSSFVGQLGAGRLNIQNALVCAMPANACITPYNLSASVTGTTALLTWNGPSNVSFNIRSRETGAATWNNATSSTASYSLPISTCKSYEFEVMANCSGGSSPYSLTKTFQTMAGGPQNYCTQTSSSAFGYIQSVAFGGISNTSGNNNGYVNATCQSASVSPGSSYNLSLTPGFPSYPYAEYWRVYIDYNQDGDFGDANEMAFDAITASSSTVNGNIVIPSSALQGMTRMRVFMKWVGSGDMNLPLPCTNYTYGEIEDYSIIIATNSTATTCNAPSGLNATNISAAGATLSWGAVSGAVNYVVEYKTLSAATWTNGGTLTATSLAVNTLIANTTYQFRVTASCSVASSAYSFTTAATACNAPTGLAAASVTANTATLNWGSSATATMYNIRVKPTTSATWSVVYGLPTTSTNASNLSSGTTYEFQIASDCGSGVVSAYSASQTFTTLQATCSAPAGFSASNISTSSALVSWTTATGASNYTVRYRIQNGTWSSEITTTTNSYQLAGLQAGTSYEIQAKTNCSASSSSGYTTSYVFTTVAPTCPMPTNAALSNITSNSMTLSWTAASGAANYTVRYKLSSVSTWTTLASTTSLSSTISGLAASSAYDVQVATNCSSNTSSFTTTVSATTNSACSMPSNLSVSNLSTTSATLNWSSVTGVASYSVQYKTNAATTWTSVTAYSNSLALSALTSATTYDFKVQTNCTNNANSGYSASLAFTTATPVTCNTPTSLTASNLQPTTADAAWASVTNANSYNVRYKPATSSVWTTTTTTTPSKIITGLSAFTIYNIQTQAVCSNTQSAYTTSTNFTTPSTPTCNAPSSIAASTIGSTTATIGWTANSAAASGYTVQYKPSSSTTWTTVSSSSNSLNLTGLSTSTAYDVKVMSNCSASSTSAYSAVVNFTTLAPSCPIPTNVGNSSLTINSINLTWTATTGASSYTIQYKPSTSTTWTTTTSSTNSKLLTSLSSGTQYNVQVMASCASSNSAYAAVYTFTTPADCGVPTNVAVSSITSTSATATWTAISSATSYTIQYKLATATVWSSTTSTTANKALSGLTAGTTYNVKVKANCGANYSAVVNFTTTNTTTNCSAPNAPSMSNIATTSATATWNAITGATSYTIQYKLATATVWSSTTSTNINAALSGLTAGTTYNVKVMPSCGTTYSAITNFTTLSTATCSTPNAPTVSSITANGATATWTAVSGASSYTIQYKLATATTWSSANSTTASYTLSGLTASSTYSVQVMTVCSSGNSTYSIATSFTTAAAATTSCSIPTGLTVSGITTSGATATWTAVSGATNYTIQYRLSTSTVWSSTSSTTTSKSLTGLVSGSIYEVKVRSNCSSGSSAYSSAVSFSTPTNSAGTQEGYDILSFESACDISNDASHIWIDKVEVGDMLNESGSNDGYADFSMLTAEVERNTKLPVHFKTAYWNIETPQHWAVWIDFNHDKVFDNVTEQVLQIQTNGNELYTSIYIAKDVPIGETLMRISLNTQNQADACTSGEGETEDYHITITDYKATNFVPIIEPLWLSSVSLNQTSCKNIAEMAYSINDELNFIAYKGQENLLRFTTNRYAAYIVWVDYNGNGEFESTELISEGEGNGDFLLNLNVPFDAITGTSALLISIEGDDLSDVEQYALTIVEGNPANPPMAYTECKEIDVQLDYSVTGNEVSMRNLSTGVYDQVVWDMGDGTQLNSPNAAHYYELPGNYQFSLSMINTELGCEKMFKGEVRVFGE
jgi:hypothetical protein